MSLTFVLGAGASKELIQNLPLGFELAESVEQLMTNELSGSDYGPIANALMATRNGYGEQHDAAMRCIRDRIQSKDSIDDFLSEWQDVPNINEIAKIAISQVILTAEETSGLFTYEFNHPDIIGTIRSFRGSWINQIIRRNYPSLPRRDVVGIFKDVSFVTFNYDRTLERYLLAYAHIVAGLPIEKAQSFVNDLNIHHAYGCIGPVADRSISSAFPTTLSRCGEGIRTFNEDAPSNLVEGVRSVIENSKKLIFLGCAYHEQNLELLFGNSKGTQREIFGTAFGMNEIQVRRIVKALSRYGSVQALDVAKCSHFLNERSSQIWRA